MENSTIEIPGRVGGAVRRSLRGEAGGTPDLQTQLEALLDQVWRCEAGWRLDDRIEQAIRRGR